MTDVRWQGSAGKFAFQLPRLCALCGEMKDVGQQGSLSRTSAVLESLTLIVMLLVVNDYSLTPVVTSSAMSSEMPFSSLCFSSSVTY